MKAWLQGKVSNASTLPTALFGLNLILAAGLVLLVLLAPWGPDQGMGTSSWQHVWALFAADLTVRRTALASAVGLVVTAFVFFRHPSAPPKTTPPKPPARPALPPRNVVGA